MKKRLLIYGGLVIFSLACASSPRFRSETKTETNKAARYSEAATRADSVLATETGTASFYADEFDGKITYSGETYDMRGISAAHPSYPMGTIVRVTNLSNGKSVILRINDRMPYRSDRIIDLSLGAAEQLDMKRDGITEVKVEVLKWGSGRK